MAMVDMGLQGLSVVVPLEIDNMLTRYKIYFVNIHIKVHLVKGSPVKRGGQEHIGL